MMLRHMSVTTMEGAVMAWYEIINAQSDSFLADPTPKIFCTNWPWPYRPKTARWKRRGFMVLPNGARRYYFSLSPEAAERTERILTSYDARINHTPQSHGHGENTPVVIDTWPRQETRTGKE